MTNKELLSQIIDHYERRSGITLLFSEDTTKESCKLSIKFPSGRVFSITVPRERMITNGPPIYHDELRELAYSSLIDLLENKDSKTE